MPSISVVIPVYNAEQTLADLCHALTPALGEITSTFEVILVEDRGADSSWRIIQELARGDPRVQGIRMSRNFGQHNALLCGIRAARHDVIVTMDDDLQNPVSGIRHLVNKLEEGYDVVYGTPHRRQHGLLRNLASWITKLALQKAMGAETGRSVSAFRAFRTRLRDTFADYRSPNVCIDVLLAWGTLEFGSVTVRHEARKAGKSNYSLFKLLTHAFNLLTGFSTLPLQIASFVGFALTLFGVGVLVYVLVVYMIHGSAVAGFPFLASIIAIFSGAQLFALGIFGEYLARIHFRTMDRPAYIVSETASGSASESDDASVPEDASRSSTQALDSIDAPP